MDRAIKIGIALVLVYLIWTRLLNQSVPTDINKLLPTAPTISITRPIGPTLRLAPTIVPVCSTTNVSCANQQPLPTLVPTMEPTVYIVLQSTLTPIPTPQSNGCHTSYVTVLDSRGYPKGQVRGYGADCEEAKANLKIEITNLEQKP